MSEDEWPLRFGVDYTLGSVTWIAPARPVVSGNQARAGDIWRDTEAGRDFILGMTPDEDVRIA